MLSICGLGSRRGVGGDAVVPFPTRQMFVLGKCLLLARPSNFLLKVRNDVNLKLTERLVPQRCVEYASRLHSCLSSPTFTT